jgi:N-glycosylase/DNA lyase
MKKGHEMNGIGISLPCNPVVSLDGNAFDPDATFGCGQCFRWEKRDDNSWTGVVYGQTMTVRKRDSRFLIEGAGGADADLIAGYFDLDRDYATIAGKLCCDPPLAAAIAFAPGIRILRQEPWEALCSFIISQNNNIPRIKGIVARLCAQFGDEIGDGQYAFPAASRIAALTIDELAPLRSGFRAAYILDAARRVASGEVPLGDLSAIPLDDARGALMKIKGVGPKVAECALLFGCGRFDAFPVDVWVKRVLARFYPDGFPQHLMRYGGLAQQYLFHYIRQLPAAPVALEPVLE